VQPWRLRRPASLGFASLEPCVSTLCYPGPCDLRPSDFWHCVLEHSVLRLALLAGELLRGLVEVLAVRSRLEAVTGAYALALPDRS
jgi:hypothetical protein